MLCKSVGRVLSSAAGRRSSSLPFSRKFSDKSDDTLLIDPYQADKMEGSHEFFEFQSGRWLENNTAELEKRRTKFSLVGILQVLRENADILQDSTVAIETIEPLFEGKHNKIYKLSLKDGRAFVLRIPYDVGSAEYRKRRLLSEVATIDFLNKKHKVKTPVPIAWSGDENNPIKKPFILMPYVKGVKMSEQWRPLHAEDHSDVLEPIAAFAALIAATKFNKYGSLYFAEDVPAHLRVDPYDDETDPELKGRWAIGPSTEKVFWRSPSGINFAGPFNSPLEYLKATAGVQSVYNPSSEAANKYQQMAPELFSEKELSELGTPRLQHPDLSPFNVLKADSNWLIDFENTAIRPLLLHGTPRFVRNSGETIYSKAQIPDFDKLSTEEQSVIEMAIRLSQNQLAYERAFHKAQPSLAQALHPSIKRRQEVVEDAVDTDINEKGPQDMLLFSLLRLSMLWPALNTNRPSPVEFSEDEAVQIQQRVLAYFKAVQRNSTLRTKGFLGTEEFNKYIAEGKLSSKGKDNYEFTKEFLDSGGTMLERTRGTAGQS